MLSLRKHTCTYIHTPSFWLINFPINVAGNFKNQTKTSPSTGIIKKYVLNHKNILFCFSFSLTCHKLDSTLPVFRGANYGRQVLETLTSLSVLSGENEEGSTVETSRGADPVCPDLCASCSSHSSTIPQEKMPRSGRFIYFF